MEVACTMYLSMHVHVNININVHVHEYLSTTTSMVSYSSAQSSFDINWCTFVDQCCLV